LVGKHSREVPKGKSSPRACVARWKVLAVLQFLTIFAAKSVVFHLPLVDTRPPTLLAAVLWSSRCLLQLECSSVLGAWSSRGRVFSQLESRVKATLCSLCHVWWHSVACGVRLLVGCFPATHGRLRWRFLLCRQLCFWVFFLFCFFG